MSLNYKHLYYFYMVAREGNLARASVKMNLTPQTISGQIKVFEQSIGEKLFRKSGRKQVVTATGNTILQYAENIFSVGRQLEDALQRGDLDRPSEFRVGVADVVPKSIAFKFLLPALETGMTSKLVCHEFDLVKLLAELAIHELDMVIADNRMPDNVDIRGYSHELGSSDIQFFAAPTLLSKLKGTFPQSLNGQPMLLPGRAAAIRQLVMDFLKVRNIYPVIVGEFDDTALLKAFGSEAIGVFFAPSIIANEIQKQFNVKSIGILSEVKQTFYAISVERKISHPAVKAITDNARNMFIRNNNLRSG